MKLFLRRPLGRELADRSYFVLCHDASLKVAAWVGYELNAAHLQPIAQRASRFRADAELLHPGARDSDYRHSGLTRGHLAPARDFAFSPQAMRATFVLSNSVPQYRAANLGRWAQLETAVRRLASQSDSLYIFTGPIFDRPHPVTIGSGHVAVPTHLFKVALALQGATLTMYAAIVPNAPVIDEALGAFLTTVDEVERRTGLDFFEGLQDSLEKDLESRLQPLPSHR